MADAQPLTTGFLVQGEAPWLTLRLSRDSALKWGTIAAMIVADVALCAARGLKFPLPNIVLPVIYVLLLGLPAVFYHRRREPKFVLCLTTLVLVIAFLPPFTLLMYAAATTERSLIDGALAGFDAWCGVSVPAIRDWTNARPAVRWLLDLAYGSLLFELPVIVIVLGFIGDRRTLEAFVLQDMIAALVTLAAFAVFPAAGPFAHYGYEPSAEQARYLDHLHGLRSGQRRVVNLSDAEGLVTCPSFHTSEALLMALAFRRRAGLFAVFGTLNVLVVVSTMTTGWHYFADVLAGLAVGALAVVAADRLGRWLYQPSSSFRSAQAELHGAFSATHSAGFVHHAPF